MTPGADDSHFYIVIETRTLLVWYRITKPERLRLSFKDEGMEIRCKDVKLKGGCDELRSTLHLGVLPALCVGQDLAGNATALGWAARSVLPSNRPATPLFSPACWEPGFQAWAQSTCPPAVHEIPVQFLGQEDPLEKG